jgi:hypothetical protein
MEPVGLERIDPTIEQARPRISTILCLDHAWEEIIITLKIYLHIRGLMSSNFTEAFINSYFM